MGETSQIENQFKVVTAIKANDNLVLKQLYQKNYKKVEIFILKNNGSMPQANLSRSIYCDVPKHQGQ